jgi:hypothetical protein
VLRLMSHGPGLADSDRGLDVAVVFFSRRSARPRDVSKRT